MSSFFAKILRIILITSGLLGLNTAMADWKTDCAKIQQAEQGANTGVDMCGPIQSEVNTLGSYMPPAPFLSKTINQFPSGVFPAGSPWSGAATTSGGTATSDVLSGTTSTSTSSTTGSTTTSTSTGTTSGTSGSTNSTTSNNPTWQ